MSRDFPNTVVLDTDTTDATTAIHINIYSNHIGHDLTVVEFGGIVGVYCKTCSTVVEAFDGREL